MRSDRVQDSFRLQMNGSRQERDRCRCCRCCHCCRRLFRHQTKKLRPASIVFCFWNLAQDFFSHPWKCNDGVLDRAVVVAPHGRADPSWSRDRGFEFYRFTILPTLCSLNRFLYKLTTSLIFLKIMAVVQCTFCSKQTWFSHFNQRAVFCGEMVLGTRSIDNQYKTLKASSIVFDSHAQTYKNSAWVLWNITES